jgi:hypothetical protein
MCRTDDTEHHRARRVFEHLLCRSKRRSRRPSRRVGRGSDLHFVLPSHRVSRHNTGKSTRRYCFTSSKSARCSSLRHTSTPDHSDSAVLHIPHGESELPDWWTSRARIVQADRRIDPFYVARPDLPILNWTSLVFTASALTEVGRLCHAPNLRTALLCMCLANTNLGPKCLQKTGTLTLSTVDITRVQSPRKRQIQVIKGPLGVYTGLCQHEPKPRTLPCMVYSYTGPLGYQSARHRTAIVPPSYKHKESIITFATT